MKLTIPTVGSSAHSRWDPPGPLTYRYGHLRITVAQDDQPPVGSGNIRSWQRILLVGEGGPRRRILDASRLHSAVRGARELMAPGPEVGETIPAFNAPDQFGQMQTLSTISGPAGAVISFVRSADW